MKLLQFTDPSQPNTSSRLGLVDGNQIIDLTSCPPHPTSLYDLYYHHGGNKNGLAAAVTSLFLDNAHHLDLNTLLNNVSNGNEPGLRSPVTAPSDAPHNLRIWLAGVTHGDSAKLREIEAKQTTGASVNVYEQKYRECAAGGIPELFSKSDTAALAGHGGPIARPANTLRLVPETELVTVYGLNTQGQVERLGYTGGNDYTDNGIEAQNPLNLPQAKNWSGGCASLGPFLVTPDEFDDTSVEVSCEVLRNGQRVAFKSGPTGQDHLNMPDGLFHLERSLFSRIPLEDGVLQILYWGTPIVFADADLPHGLQENDIVRMTFAGIGTLENPIFSFPETSQLGWLEKHRA
ncbi:MAG: fumarylacetoacetate hydrolase family protein [bacterium]|nr:fumarylacetoacetate hydrolase family protein [bacterium]